MSIFSKKLADTIQRPIVPVVPDFRAEREDALDMAVAGISKSERRFNTVERMISEYINDYKYTRG